MLNNAVIFLASTRPVTWYWEQCDPAAKFIVVILICCSVWSITTILQKYFELRNLRTDNLAFESQLHRENRLTKIKTFSGNRKNLSPYSLLFNSALSSLNQHSGEILDEREMRLRMGHVENAIQRAIGRVTARYEKGMIPLSTFVSGGPFLGLLGTVWGVMVTFGALTEKASIAELAPGVSGALVATAFGLLLAIPASFAYNWVLGRTRQMATELDNFASSLGDKIELELLEDLQNKQRKKEEVSPAPARGNPFLRDDGVSGTPSSASHPRLSRE